MNRVENETAACAGLSVPVASEWLVPVDGVSQRLSDAVGRVAVVTAPAGYGKTSQVATWAHSDGRPVAWATMNRCSNDPDWFLSLLLDMLQHVTGVDPGEFVSRRSEAEQYGTVVAAALGRLVRDCSTPLRTRLDDVHIIDRATGGRPAPSGARPPSTGVDRRTDRENRAACGARPAPGCTRVSSRCRRKISRSIDLEHSNCSDRWASRSPTSPSSGWWNAEGWPVGIRMAALAERDIGGDGPTQRSIGHDRAIADFVREEWLHGDAG